MLSSFPPDIKAIQTHKKSHPPRPSTASAVGKAIIVGEHAVLYGARAVAMPLPTVTMNVSLQPVQQRNADGSPLTRLSLGKKAVSDHLQGIVSEAFEALGIEPFGVDIEGSSKVLMGAGLGSSAALCVVVLRAISQSVGLVLERDELASLANRLETRFHGKPSGLDTAVVAFETLIHFRKGSIPMPFRPVSPQLPQQLKSAAAPKWSFALIDSGLRAPTMGMIHVAAPYFSGVLGEKRVQVFDDLAGQVIAGLQKGAWQDVAAAMNEAQISLAATGVVNETLADIVARARAAEAAGVAAAKVTGAGGGGCVLCLLEPRESRESVGSVEQDGQNIDRLRSYFPDLHVMPIRL